MKSDPRQPIHSSKWPDFADPSSFDGPVFKKNDAAAEKSLASSPR
jgi:hypothetical protein